MPPLKRKRQQRRTVVPNVSQRPVGTSTTPARRPSTLPPQYNFTPPPEDRPTQLSPQVPEFVQQSTNNPHIANYPPPQQLFQSPSSQGTATPPNQLQNNLQSPAPNSQGGASQGQSRPSSQGNNFDEPPPVEADLDDNRLQALNALLLVPDRETFTTVLSPTPKPNTVW